ncbi:hypothetical protein TCON_2120 [Astathelohania contejeani]|uniref:Uncharacterized protein n=1 Tax=Astathelohania contejeani TaxID=164912 RepID=A0ABQ7HWW5_9MICR|nr:hypothetical protein TCON_2120 [Thelohania contejeani]
MNKQWEYQYTNELDKLLLPIVKLYGQIQDINEESIIDRILQTTIQEFNMNKEQDITIKLMRNNIINQNLFIFRNDILNFKTKIEALLCGDIYFLKNAAFRFGRKQREITRKHIQTKYPYYMFRNYIQDVDMMLTDLSEFDIHNEESLRAIFNDIDVLNNINVTGIFDKFKEWFKNNPNSLILKYISQVEKEEFIHFIKVQNKINTGCFRYSLSNLEDRIILIKERYKERFCNKDLTLDERNIIADGSHPLSDQTLAWDCNSSSLEGLLESSSFEKAVFNKGCRALCNPHNYNIAKTYLYPELLLFPINSKFNKTFIYICEKGSILRSISIELQEHIINPNFKKYKVLKSINNKYNVPSFIIILLVIITFIAIILFSLYILKMNNKI